MAVKLSDWKTKFPDVEDNTLRDWIIDMTIQDVAPEHQERYLQMRSEGNHPSNEQLENNVQSQEEDPSEENEADEADEGELDEEDLEAEAEEASLQDEIKESNLQTPKPSGNPIPFENPNLDDLNVPEEELEEEEMRAALAPRKDIKREQTPSLSYTSEWDNRKNKHESEFHKRTIQTAEYEQAIEPWLPLFEGIRASDYNGLTRTATSINPKQLPPWMQMKQMVLNHPIKDPNNTRLNIKAPVESGTTSLEQREEPLMQAIDITRGMAGQSYHQDSYDNYHQILNRMVEERRELVSLIYILENYLEQRQSSPFELSVPKTVVTESIKESFGELRELITQNVINELSQLRGDISGELGDVSEIIEQNMGRFDQQIQEAVTRVMWKVKTDVESTNMEDIKRTFIWLLNKRGQAYNLGGGATAIITVMLDDLTRRLIENGFKFDEVEEHRKYDLAEITRRLGYKKQTTIVRAIPRLKRANLIKVYDNKTISL